MLYLPRNPKWELVQQINHHYFDELVAAERRYQDEIRTIHEEAAKQWAKAVKDDIDRQLPHTIIQSPNESDTD